MYRTNDPRFRRRLNEIGQTLESANESAQSSIYIFGQNYIKPCLDSVASCVGSCVDASCPSLSQRDRLRRQRGRGQGRAELNFDFYDDWDDDENDALLGWGNDDLDRPVAGGGGTYGTVTQTQPGRQKGMVYPRGRSKGMGLSHDADATTIPGGSLLGKLFGGRQTKYKPSAAGLQEHPGTRRPGRDQTEGEALLEEHDYGRRSRERIRARSGTATSADTSDSYSSRGDIFPSDDEHDAIPLDDEFAMILERRTSQNDGTSGRETESSSGQARSKDGQRGKRPSAGSRTSTRRTFSSRSSLSARKNRSRPSSERQTPMGEDTLALADSIPSISELKHEDHAVEGEEAAEMEQAASAASNVIIEELSSKEATPHSTSPPTTDNVDELDTFAVPQSTEGEQRRAEPLTKEPGDESST